VSLAACNNKTACNQMITDDNEGMAVYFSPYFFLFLVSGPLFFLVASKVAGSLGWE
jgi:hypothetical protein